MLPLILLALGADPTPPPFRVVANNAPAFRVVANNATAPSACICVSAPGGVGTCGSYLCPANGGSGGCVCNPARPSPVTPAPSAVPVVSAGHSCPRCGAHQNVVHRQVGGTHSHKCGACGTEWFHENPGSVAAPVALPGSYTLGGCSGPNCPAPARVGPIRRLFGR